MGKMLLDMAGGSDIGCVRKENQDHFLIADLRRQLTVRDTDVPSDELGEMYGCREGNLMVVADGMGGHSNGEKASRIAVKATAQYVLDMMQWFLKLSPGVEQDFEDELAESLAAVQRRIWIESDQGERSMGTTVTMSYLLWPKMYVVHAGDSRCYLFRQGVLRQLTTDHTIAQQFVDSGSMSIDDPGLANWRHVLWNCVGGGAEKVRPEAIRIRLQVSDTILLCSDGLCGMVGNDVIAAVLAENLASNQSVNALIDAAKQRGGKDNIAVVVCRVTGGDDCDPQTVSGFDSTIVEAPGCASPK